VKSVSCYSLNLTGFNISNYFIRNADYILIGRFIGAGALGFYTLAYNLMLFPLQNISAIIGRVMFPAYSRIQDDDTIFRSVYLKVACTIALITFPMMTGLWALAEPFVLAIFGSRWSPVIILIMILAPVGLLQSIGTTVGSIYQAKGRTDWMFRWGSASGVIRIIAFVIGLQWGVVGVATAYAVSTVLLIYPGYAIPLSLINLRVSELWRALLRPLASSSVMLLILLVLKVVLPGNLPGGLTMSISIPIGIIVYFLGSLVLNREQMQEIMHMVKG
jgi:lipopolysaccharide exporter